jgi:Autographiviridae endonuclease VII
MPYKNIEDRRRWSRDYARKAYREDPEKYKKLARDIWKRDPRRAIDYQLRSKYGITLQEFEEMERAQHGCCAICQEAKKLVVDHNHQTGKVRELLCYRCNTVVGLIETYKILDTAINYLRKHD